MIGIKDRGRLPERQVTAAKTRRLQDYERQGEREREAVRFVAFDEKRSDRGSRRRRNAADSGASPWPINRRLTNHNDFSV